MFRENRLPFVVRIRDVNQELIGRIAVVCEVKTARNEFSTIPVCNLNISLPKDIHRDLIMEMDEEPSQSEQSQQAKAVNKKDGGNWMFLN